MAPLPSVVLLRRDVYPSNDIMQHEFVHHAQQREMLIVLFWIVYGLEFLIRWISMRNWQRAYRRISFEVEAGKWEELRRQGRPFLNWVNYL